MNGMDCENRADEAAPAGSNPLQGPGGPTPIGSTVFRHRIRTAEDLADYNRTNGLFDVMPTGGTAIDFEIEGLRNDSFCIWRLASESGFLARPTGLGATDSVIVKMTCQGRLECHDHAREHVAEPGFGLLIPLQDMRDVQASHSFGSLNCLFHKDRLADHQRALSGENAGGKLDFEAVADLDTPALRSFRASVLAIFGRLTHGPAAGELAEPLLEELLLHQLIGSWPQAPVRQSPVGQGSSRHVRQALDFIEAHLAQPLTVAEVASAAGIGVRALQASFRKDLGRTPVQHIIDRRLEQAHDDLRRDERSAISAIASRWGFVHMSDFSRRYRQRFGCTPSETQIRSGRGN